MKVRIIAIAILLSLAVYSVTAVRDQNLTADAKAPK